MKFPFHRGGVRPSRAKSNRILQLQSLESREVPALNPTGAEQEMLELLNHLRTDPQAHYARLVSAASPITSPDAGVTSALRYFNVNAATLRNQWNGLTAAQPVAWNESLVNAAAGHNTAMIGADTQSHQLPGEAGMGTRATNAGYAGWTALAENIYAYSDSAFFGHAGFAIDWGGSAATGGIQSPAGHRNNMMSNAYREVGIKVTNDTNPATDVGPQVITQDFGNRSALSGGGYLLGVVFNDLNANSSYNAGEGLGGVTVQVTGAGGFNRTLTSMSAGGYQTFLSPGTYAVTFSGGGLATAVTRSVTVGSANVKVDVISGAGGGNTDTNAAPVLNIAPVQTLRPVATNATPAGTPVGTLLGGVANDADAGDTVGVAVTALGGAAGGTWQYSTSAGASWQNFGAVSAASARLLAPTDQVRFVPFANYTGAATIGYKAWDGTTTATDATTGGGSTAFSSATETATVRVQSAPTLDPARVGRVLNVAEDSTTHSGTTVNGLLSQGFADANAGTLTGAALTGLSNAAEGVWQYRYANSVTWRNIGAVSPSNAFLLRGTDNIRFVPAANFNGSVSVTFRAWDRSQGTLAGRWNVADSADTGGGTAFSSQAATVAGLIVNANDAPVLNTAASPSFAPVAGAPGAVSVSTVAALLGSAATDVDGTALAGVAVIGVTRHASCVWEYSTNGGATWGTLNTTAWAAARLLRSTDLIRVRTLTAVASPLAARLVFRAWDQTQGAAGGTWNLSAATSFGGRTAFSAGADAAPITVG